MAEALAPGVQHKPATFAIVIKGPLLAFTVNVIRYYAQHLGDSTAIIFSHNNGSCFTARAANTLQQLQAEFPQFASVIMPAPPVDGYNFRNAQREACYYGTMYAMQHFKAKYVFTQRPDTVFQSPTVLADLRALLHSHPPPAVPMPGGRVGLCPFQTQFTDFYGRFALDDHCMFGHPRAVLHFWSISNPMYRRDERAWSSANNSRHGCKAPGVESDNGFIWAMHDFERHKVPPPVSTKQLIEERAFVINPEAWDHVCLRGRGHLNVPLPCNTSLNQMRFSRIAPAAPYGVFSLCEKHEQLYNCSVVGEVQNRTDTPKWACFATHTRC